MEYKVKAGDGWYRIAKNLGVDVNDLLKANNATLNTAIHPGQVLKTGKQSGFGQLVKGLPQKEEKPKTLPTPYRSEYTEQQLIKANAKSIQQQLVDAGYDLGRYGIDGKWGKASQAALDKALSEGYRLDRGKLVSSKKVSPQTAPVSNPFIPAGYQAGAVRHLQGQVTKSEPKKSKETAKEEPKKESTFWQSMGFVPLESYGAYSGLENEEKPQLSETESIEQNAKSIQSQLTQMGYNLGKVDGIWGPRSKAALEQAKKDGFILQNGKLSKSSLNPRKPEARTVQEAASDKIGELIDMWFEPDEDAPKNRINYFRRPNKVLSKEPAIINGETIDACAKYGNCKLSQQGYISNGHAWTRHNNQRTIYSGYNTKNRPTTYNEDSVVKYNSEAADNVVRDFDFNTLDKNSVYTVGMYYKGSPAQERAYNEGVDGVTNTHTGNLFWNPEADSWVVEHNIHGTAITNELRDVLGSRGKYGVTGIYQPYKNTVMGNAGAFIRGINK